jgi:glycosyltransferase involved in cell wall biosynthesis
MRIKPDGGFKLDAKSFRFLHVSSCFPRKGADLLLWAYGRVFRASDDVTLVIKTFRNPHNEIYRWLADARGDDAEFPHVLVIEDDYTDAQLKALYGQCQALVAPSRAEGFGLPMAEAMLSGLAVITTGWSGQVDFCNADTAWLVDFVFSRANTHFNLSASLWAEPDEVHLAQLMREVYETPENERNRRVAAGQKLLSERFLWSHTAARMVKSARRWATRGEPSDPRVGWVSTWNTRCGIASYSQHLLAAISGDITVLAAHCDSQTAEDKPNVRRCWASGETDDLTSLAAAVDELELDTLVVQFNYGFFSLEKLSAFISRQLDAGRTVVVVLHSTVDPLHAQHKKLSIVLPALQRCQRVLVHSPDDMNRLKEHGLIENVSLFPHGIVDFKPSRQPSDAEEGRLRLASYGFFLPHKGLVELVEAVALLTRRGIAVRLDMINAKYPALESEMLIWNVCKLIKERQLEDTVFLTTDYLKDEDSLNRIGTADLILFPYQKTGESSSAAVRQGIASGRPVAVTPLDIFEDVEPAVFKLPGTSPAEIAKGILAFMKHDPSMRQRKQQSAADWCSEHYYSKVGPRLYRMLVALRK